MCRVVYPKTLLIYNTGKLRVMSEDLPPIFKKLIQDHNAHILANVMSAFSSGFFFKNKHIYFIFLTSIKTVHHAISSPHGTT